MNDELFLTVYLCKCAKRAKFMFAGIILPKQKYGPKGLKCKKKCAALVTNIILFHKTVIARTKIQEILHTKSFNIFLPFSTLPRLHQLRSSTLIITTHRLDKVHGGGHVGFDPGVAELVQVLAVHAGVHQNLAAARRPVRVVRCVCVV